MKTHSFQNDNMWKGASPSIFSNAKQLRLNRTAAELRLWEALKGNKLGGYKFRSQHPISSFVLDFYCHKLKLAIEVDGLYHNTEEQKKYDRIRTKKLEEQGIKLIRFTNDEVINDLANVLNKIRAYF